MTVPTENRISGPYNGNGVTVAFGFDFLVIDDAHLRVVLTDAAGVPTDLVLGVNYTVFGVGLPEGGNVQLTVAPASGQTVTILRSVPFTQETDLENQGAFQAQTIEDALDLSVMRDLLLLGRVNNAIHAPDTEEVDMELPPVALRKNSYLLFDANGEPTYVNSQIDARYYGALGADPATRPDGSARQAGDAYFSTTTLGFRVFSGSGWQAAIPPASLTLVNFTETSASAKTTFTISGGYTVGTAFAYLNGVLLAPSEVTMSNGTTAVLAAACSIGDEFRLVGYSAFSVADTLSRASNLNDLPDKPTALTNLGFSAFVQGLKAIANAALFRAGIGAAQEGGITTASILPASLVTAAESIGANNNDTTIPTSAAVKGYADAAAAARGMTLLATLTTTSGTVQTASSLDLTTYTALYIAINGVSFTGAASLTMNGVTITQGTAGAADALYGHHWLSLATGVSMGGGEVVAASPGSATVVQRVARSGYSNATTSISFGGGTFDAGQILIYGVR